MASLSFAFGCRLGVDRNGMSTRTSPFSGSRIMDNGLRAAIRNNERAATQRRSSWQGVKAVVRDPHQILGVPVGATEADVKKAFRTLARRLHPDVNKAPDAAAQFMRLNDAYTSLLSGHSSAASALSSRPQKQRMEGTVSLQVAIEQLRRGVRAHRRRTGEGY